MALASGGAHRFREERGEGLDFVRTLWPHAERAGRDTRYPALNFSLSPSPSRAVHLCDPILPFGVLTAITKAYRAEVTSAAHGLSKGDRVTFASVDAAFSS